MVVVDVVMVVDVVDVVVVVEVVAVVVVEDEGLKEYWAGCGRRESSL